MATKRNEEKTSLEMVNKFTKDTMGIIKSKATTITKDELKFIVHLFYSAQKDRIAVNNQFYALTNGNMTSCRDELESASYSIIKWELDNQTLREKELLKVLKLVAESDIRGQWLTSIVGIGPTIAANLMAQLDVTKVRYASQFISYCGLSSQSIELGGRPWTGKKEASKIVEDVIEEIGDDKITAEHINLIAARTKWSVDHIQKDAAIYGDKKNPDKITGYSKENVIKSISKIPYNKELKTLMFKIGESFIKQSNNKKSLYGRLYKEYRADYTRRNELGEYKERAAKILTEKNFSKSTNAYKAYSQGKLPDAHIIAMARRKTLKIFISHLFECFYVCEYGDSIPPVPYVYGEKLGDGRHRGEYIEPEVPFPRGYVSPLVNFNIDLSKDINVEQDYKDEVELVKATAEQVAAEHEE